MNFTSFIDVCLYELVMSYLVFLFLLVRFAVLSVLVCKFYAKTTSSGALLEFV